MGAPQEFRYKITSFVDGVLTLDERVLRYKQGLRQVQVPYANIRRFGLKVRGKSLGGVVTSELLLRTEPAPGKSKLVSVALDPGHRAGQAALAALRARLPEADTTLLPWDEAAARLGVKANTWQDGLVTRWGMIGTTLVAAAAGMTIVESWMTPATDSSTLRARGIVRLLAVVLGVMLLVIGFRQAKKAQREQRAQNEKNAPKPQP